MTIQIAKSLLYQSQWRISVGQTITCYRILSVGHISIAYSEPLINLQFGRQRQISILLQREKTIYHMGYSEGNFSRTLAADESKVNISQEHNLRILWYQFHNKDIH